LARGWRRCAARRVPASILRRALVVGALPLALGACGESNKPISRVKVYQSVEACQAEHPLPPEGTRLSEQRDAWGNSFPVLERFQPPPDLDCAKAFADARSEHANSVPRYETQQACEASHGDGHCEVHRTDAGSWFVPAMMGFIAGRSYIGTNGTSVYPPVPVSQPIYIDRTGAAYSRGDFVGTYYRNCPVGSTDPACRPSSPESGWGYVYNSGSGGSGGSSWSSSGSRSSVGSTSANGAGPRAIIWTTATYHIEQAPEPRRGGFGYSASSISKPLSGSPGPALSSTSSISRGGFGATATHFASAGT